MRETEITVQVYDDLNVVKQKLEVKGFKMIEEFFMHDYYFSKHSIDKLKTYTFDELIKNSFLIRKMVDANPKTMLMFKDKTIDENNNVISEEKIKCNIDNAEKAIKIFNNCGLTNWCNISQDILIYEKESIAFALQIVEGLGVFIEYEEDASMADLTEKQKIDLMLSNLKTLGLNLGDDYSCKKVYLMFKKDNNNQ